MDSNVPSKMLGLFKAFKACTEKMQQTKSQLKSSEEQKGSSTNCIQVIKRTGDVAVFDAEKIAVAIGKAFLAVEGQQSDKSSRIQDCIPQITEMVIKVFNSPIDYELYSRPNTIKQSELIPSKSLNFSKCNKSPCIPSIFKKFKNITLTIIFITTRNFSIQKNLSISA